MGCIKLMVNLGSEITKLVRRFEALNVCISTVIRTHVTKFVETITRTPAKAGSGDGEARLGSITFTGFQRSVSCRLIDICSQLTFANAFITQHSTCARAYSGLFTDIAVMWNERSSENIFPGIAMCEQLSVQSGESAGDTQEQGARAQPVGGRCFDACQADCR